MIVLIAKNLSGFGNLIGLGYKPFAVDNDLY
jgi:hypothetical protein